ncbi:putative Proteasome complex subunit Rpn13 ubiquitin receptor [Trypanosoma vivax]|uniref:Pru domain-containing protein n=1 Tax=Trypanosoma vivax (strain Y486) TaxID=1055687 RepID=G0U3K7_TRYVY|nr:hypothetical protein TRVL_09603 [Trypanosoma vivax]KAH8613910.1 putative Proteasome complex subunit Rpn13 ubiquitin receptor [Trypanosoma vivax]CCC50864.1 conserved hypothetical protein [Trypanosoma vivax Y486]
MFILPPVVTESASQSLVEVAAGRMELRDGVVYPLLKKGFMLVLRDALTHNVTLVWAAADGSEEQRTALIPGRVSVSWVAKCLPSRVMLFDIDNHKRLLFFWMQSRSTAPDSVMRRVQDAIQRYCQPPINPPRNHKITMSTMQSILSELLEEAAAQDVSLSSLLVSEKLVSALDEDAEFYMSRLKRHLPPGQRAVSVRLGVIELIRDSQVQWTAEILDILLRHKLTYTKLFSTFLNGPMLWGQNVISFIMNVINYVESHGEQKPPVDDKEHESEL